MTETNAQKGSGLQDPPAELRGDHAAILAYYMAERPDPWKDSKKQTETPIIEGAEIKIIDAGSVEPTDADENKSENQDQSKQNEKDDQTDTRTEEQMLADRHDYWRRNPWG